MFALSPLWMLLAATALADDPDAFSVEGTSVTEEALPDAVPEAPSPERMAGEAATVQTKVDPLEPAAAPSLAPAPPPLAPPLAPVTTAAPPEMLVEDEAPPELIVPPSPMVSEPEVIAPTAEPHTIVAAAPEPSPPLAASQPVPPTPPASPTPPVAPTPPASPETIAAHLGAAGRLFADRAREKAATTSEHAKERLEEHRSAKEAPPSQAPAALVEPDCDCEAPMASASRGSRGPGAVAVADTERDVQHNRHRRSERHRQWYVGTDIHATTLAGTPSLMHGFEAGTVGKHGLVLGMQGLSGDRVLQDGRHIALDGGGVRLGWAFRSHRQLGLRFDTLIGGTLLTDAARDREIGALQLISPRASIDWKPYPWLQVSPNVGVRHLTGLGTHGALSAPTIGVSVRVGRF